MRQTKVVTVAEGQYTTIPDDKHMLVGPAELEVTRYPEGQVRGRIISGRTVSAERAVKLKLTRIPWGI